MRLQAFAEVCLCSIFAAVNLGCGGGGASAPSSSAAGPAIMTYTSSRTVSPGETVTFSTEATGSGRLTYQWERDGAAISSATAASYTTCPVTAADNGAKL